MTDCSRKNNRANCDFLKKTNNSYLTAGSKSHLETRKNPERLEKSYNELSKVTSSIMPQKVAVSADWPIYLSFVAVFEIRSNSPPPATVPLVWKN
jgi:hypothetical protein